MEGRVMGIYIKGFKPQDGLYVIKDGVIRKYKGNGGTVRPYDLVEVKEPHGRLIDAAMEELDGGTPYDIPNKITALPSAQPEIIRCRDCKYFAGEGMYCGQNICVQFDHFYCYYGERKEESND